MTDFPKRLIDGYSAFLAERLPHEQSRYRELAEQRAVAGDHGDRLLRFARARPRSSSTPGRAKCSSSRNIANLVPPYTPDGAQRSVFGRARIRACRR